MKRYIKITIWTIVAILILGVCIIGGIILTLYLQKEKTFKETTIYPDNKPNPTDTVLNVNGIEIKMIGIRGGNICFKGLSDTINLHDFYIADCEVTQKLWTEIMGENPSFNQECDSLPVENVDLVDCLTFVNRLDSISGLYFYIPSSLEWTYASKLGQSDRTLDEFAWWKNNSQNTTHTVKQKEPNSVGIYDMAGNVSEWTIGGSNPLFLVMGGNYESDQNDCEIDSYEIYHANIKEENTGLRLVFYPKSDTSEK